MPAPAYQWSVHVVQPFVVVDQSCEAVAYFGQGRTFDGGLAACVVAESNLDGD